MEGGTIMCMQLCKGEHNRLGKGGAVAKAFSMLDNKLTRHKNTSNHSHFVEIFQLRHFSTF
jgi:hypothetical protein